MIELAVVLVIIGLLVGGGIAALDATTTQTRRSEQVTQLERVREALYGFAMSRGRLPCADTTTPPDGIEEFSSGSCDAAAGFGALPWVTLGLARRDSWGEPLYYAVDRDWADAPPSTGGSSFQLADDPVLDVYDDAPVGAADLVAEDVPAIVLSFGPQGGQIWLPSSRFDCSSATPAGFSDEETENCDDDNGFVDPGYRSADASEGRFDDLVSWVPAPVLKSRMVQADRLP